MTAESEILATEGLRKSFGVVHAVDNINLALNEGVITAIIGPNGAGKTTFINLLSGNMAADAGHIRFRGADVTRLPAFERVRLGLGRSFQITNVFPSLTVFENVQVPVLRHLGYGWSLWRRVGSAADARRRVEDVLAAIGLADKAALPARFLSHGDQRLLEVGIALAAEPKLLLLDEPTAGMNPIERGRILEMIAALNAARRATFVIIEHDMDVVFQLAGEIVVLNRGQILAQGSPAAIRDDARVADIYLGRRHA